jgi:hypothetical protein
MSANYVGFDLDGTLHIIPLHAIRAIEITPALKTLIKYVVPNVRRAR